MKKTNKAYKKAQKSLDEMLEAIGPYLPSVDLPSSEKIREWKQNSDSFFPESTRPQKRLASV
ncbi:MAG: hypothetical protein HZC54_11435 [Verrucomicrobia bacterium]|nr:hypothetical protein [Verrucomicrobiota bacterium]